jgi:hypothetical protein
LDIDFILGYQILLHTYTLCNEILTCCRYVTGLYQLTKYGDTMAGTLQNEENCSSRSGGARNSDFWKGHADPLLKHKDTKKNIVYCLEGRESGVSWSQACSYGGYAGRNCEKWTPFLEGTFAVL